MNLKESVLMAVRHAGNVKKGELSPRFSPTNPVGVNAPEGTIALAEMMMKEGIVPDIILSSDLPRNMESAVILAETFGLPEEKVVSFNEMPDPDYGICNDKLPDEVYNILGNGDEEAGKEVLKAWNNDLVLPEGWSFDIPGVINTWEKLAKMVETEYAGKKVLFVSTNSAIRFLPEIMENPVAFGENNNLKVGINSISIFSKTPEDKYWTNNCWNSK